MSARDFWRGLREGKTHPENGQNHPWAGVLDLKESQGRKKLRPVPIPASKYKHHVTLHHLTLTSATVFCTLTLWAKINLPGLSCHRDKKSDLRRNMQEWIPAVTSLSMQ